MLHILRVAASTMLAVIVGAQTPLRTNDLCMDSYAEGGEKGWLTARGTTLDWTISGSGTGLGSVTATLPFDHPGSITHLGGKKFLVAGRDIDHSVTPAVAGDCVIVLVELVDTPSRSITLVSSQAFPNRDFVRAHYNVGEQMLYAYDSVQEELVFGVVGSPPGIPSTFLVAADATAIDLLANTYLIKLAATPSAAGVRVARVVSREESVFGYDVSYVGSGWAAVPVLEGLAESTWSFWSQYENALGPVVSVTGATGTFALTMVGGGDVVTGASPAATARTDVTTTLLPGAKYFVRSTQIGVGDSPLQTINSVWGQVCPSANLTIQRDLTDRCFIGNQDFMVTGRVMWKDPEDQTVGTRACHLIIGFDMPGLAGVTVNPVTNCASIDNIFAIVGPLSVEIQGKDHGHMVVPLPIPNDPGLAGLHIVFQWAAEDGAELALSEVYGSLLWPAPTATAAATTGSGGGSVSAQAAAAQVHRARNWLNGQFQCAWNAQKHALKLRVQTPSGN